MANGFYRTTGAIAALVAMNILVWFMKIPIETNYLIGNHLTESLMVIGLIGVLLDLNFGYLQKISGNRDVMSYLKLGFIALIFGAVLELFLFAGLMFAITRMEIITSWFLIAPYTIFLIGLPVLWISDRMRYRRRLIGITTENGKGVLTNMILCFIWTFIVGYILFSQGYLVI